MLTQILLYLPVKSLLLYKSISQQWFSLISDAFFINKYNLQNSLSIQGLYIQSSRRVGASPELEYVPLDGSSSTLPFKTLGFINDPLGIRIEQSCNGLICCRSWCHANNYIIYYLCNPCTRKYRPIVCESQKHEKGFEILCTVSLAYDPLESHHYKIICIWMVTNPDFGNCNYQIEIYSSETASWKLSGQVFSKPYHYYYFDSGVFWNGSLHWIDRLDAGSFFYVHVDRELRMEMDMPVNDQELEMEVKYFGECKGHLYLIMTHSFSPTSFEILEMKTDYTGWDKRYIINLQELKTAYARFELNVSHEFDVLLVKEVEGESPNLVLLVGDKVNSYDLHDMSFKEIQQLAPGDRDNAAYQYIQTLSCV